MWYMRWMNDIFCWYAYFFLLLVRMKVGLQHILQVEQASERLVAAEATVEVKYIQSVWNMLCYSTNKCMWAYTNCVWCVYR
jgi:hypothetical protein